MTGVKRSGREQRESDPEYPRRPVLTALSVPVAALLSFVGGVLGPLSGMVVPAVALMMGGAIWLAWAVLSLCPSRVLRVVAMVLMIAPMFAAPLCAMDASRALVLQARGVSRPAVITRITVHHVKSTTYDCTVRYGSSAKAATDAVGCGDDDRVGDHVKVVRDPGELVAPEFDGRVRASRAEVGLAAGWEAALLTVSASAVAVGAVVRLVSRSRAATRTTGP